MAKVDVSELKGAALDWAVAVCENKPIQYNPMGFEGGAESGYWIWENKSPIGRSIYLLIGRDYSPSSDWAQAGEIMERYDIFPSRYFGCGENNPNKYQAGNGRISVRGETPLIAVMRAFILTKLGEEEMDIPDPLHAELIARKTVSLQNL